MKLAGKVAIVTGTSPNIGGGIAEGLADEGAAVACVDVEPENAAAVRGLDHEAAVARRSAIACDVTDEAQVAAMVARVRESYGGVDVLVNNAGHPRRPQRARDAARALERVSSPSTSPARSSAPSTSARLMVERGTRRQHHRDRLDRRAPGPGRQHRLLHEQERAAELHARRRHGPGPATAFA